MVRDLVVADEIGVDDRAAQVQVADQRLGRHVPADHRGEGPQERVQPAAADPRADVVAALPGRLGKFPHDLCDEPDEGAHGVIGNRKIRVVALAHPPPLMGGDAHGQNVLLGVAGVEVPRPAPSACNKPCPSECRRSISAAERGWLRTSLAPLSFSSHRKAGMSNVLPCKIPHWLAPVWEDHPVSHPSSR